MPDILPVWGLARKKSEDNSDHTNYASIPFHLFSRQKGKCPIPKYAGVNPNKIFVPF